MTDVLLSHIADGVAVLTLSRPDSRNALNSELLRAIPAAVADADADDAVAAIVLTGADPAFCAGLDLKELGATGGNLNPAGGGPTAGGEFRGAWKTVKPVIGAINGVAVTGGFELALQCDFLIASERARFGDTHARVGLLPTWGLSVLLPQAIGVRRALEMSLTGNFLSAEEAHHFGLVNRVVAHDELLPTAIGLGRDIATNDQQAVQSLLDEYRTVTATTVAEGLRIEGERGRAWNAKVYDPAEIERRRAIVQSRGRTQT